jgi:hypothetical protein
MKYPILLIAAAFVGLSYAYPENSFIYKVAISAHEQELNQYDWSSRWSHTTSKLNQINGMIVLLGQQIAELDAQCVQIETGHPARDIIVQSRHDLWQKYLGYIALARHLKETAQDYAGDDIHKKMLPEIAAITSYPFTFPEQLSP